MANGRENFAQGKETCIQDRVSTSAGLSGDTIASGPMVVLNGRGMYAQCTDITNCQGPYAQCSDVTDYKGPYELGSYLPETRGPIAQCSEIS
jgi:hypothetical protein